MHQHRIGEENFMRSPWAASEALQAQGVGPPMAVGRTQPYPTADPTGR